METSYGLKFELLKEINPTWDNYDKTVAQCHLKNVGVIIVDTEYHNPIDNEYDLDEIYRILETKISEPSGLT
jgi:hypothetical protein